jgi:hypothetical protein
MLSAVVRVRVGVGIGVRVGVGIGVRAAVGAVAVGALRVINDPLHAARKVVIPTNTATCLKARTPSALVDLLDCGDR